MVFLLRRVRTGRKKSTLNGLNPFKIALTSVTVDDLHHGPHCSEARIWELEVGIKKEV